MKFDEHQFEDDAWNDPTAFGIVAAVVIVAVIVAVGTWLNGNTTVAGALSLLAGR